MSNQPPSLADLEAMLRENPELRAQASSRGVLNSALPDALRAKREAIELRRKLAEAKASLDDYAARKAASQRQLADGQKTLDALKTCRAKPAPAKPAAVVKAVAPAESEREKLWAQYRAITGATEKLTFRRRWWNQLAGQIQAPKPRKA